MDEAPKPVELLLLRIIDKVPAFGNDYRLEKILGWTDLFGFQWAVIAKQIVAKTWLTQDLRDKLNYYEVTALGKQILHDYYNANVTGEYLVQIRANDFVIGLLKKMDEE